MKITELFRKKELTLSFEVFPPKTAETFESVKSATEEVALLSPDYMSVTCGAGGSNAGFNLEIAENLLNKGHVTPIAHLTCVSAGKDAIDAQLSGFKMAGIENILALRGDIPEKGDYTCVFPHASDLTEYVKSKGDFCVGGACYPEGHPESPSQKEDIAFLKEKVEKGCEYLTTQMFFDNNILYSFLYKVLSAGINVPVVAGIMPVTNAKSIKRICGISGSQLPQRFLRIVDAFGEDETAMKQAGIAYATEQIIDLIANGVKHIHLYTMNKPEIARAIKSNLTGIL
ncbi:MAG: methylenetetrahydrofolate reductase [Lachnospiraceae bacterium]|nr:methylenetetrahydrofolate reductase [Lachnospiraceae bacterium]